MEDESGEEFLYEVTEVEQQDKDDLDFTPTSPATGSTSWCSSPAEVNGIQIGAATMTTSSSPPRPQTSSDSSEVFDPPRS